MNKLFFATLCLVPVAVWPADDLATRTDLYGPVPSQYNFVNFTSTTSVKTTSGVLGCININNTAAVAFQVYDSTSVNVTTPVIARFPASAVVGTRCYNAVVNNGIQVNMGASGPDVTVTYR